MIEQFIVIICKHYIALKMQKSAFQPYIPMPGGSIYKIKGGFSILESAREHQTQVCDTGGERSHSPPSTASLYVPVRQQPVTNLLTKWMPGNLKENPVTRFLQDTIQGLTIRFTGNLSDALQIGISTYKLLDALTAVYTLNSAKSSEVTFSVAEYAEQLGVADRKAVRAGLQRNLALLDSLHLSYQSSGKKGGHGIRDGAIEYSADVLLGLQMKGAGTNGFNVLDAMQANPREVELLVLKNRNGEVGASINFNYYAAYNLFWEQGTPLPEPGAAK